jgi:hypothetical protein
VPSAVREIALPLHAGRPPVQTPSSRNVEAAAVGRGAAVETRRRQDLNKKKFQFFIDEGVSPCSTSAAVTTERCSCRAAARGIRRSARCAAGDARGRAHGRIYRTLEKKIPVTLQLDIVNRFFDDDLGANIVGDSRHRQSCRKWSWSGALRFVHAEPARPTTPPPWR